MISSLAHRGLSEEATNVAAIAGVAQLWSQTLGDPRVMVAVLDGPVELRHPCFAGARVESTGPAPQAESSAAEHGTHVASILFGQHGGPVLGLAPGCRGVVIPVFGDGDDGSVVPCSQFELARAVTRAVEHFERSSCRALVINISGGQFAPSGEAHPLLADVVRRCDRERVLIVAAAGNQGCECLHVPGAIPSVLAVGAMNHHGAPLEFSNWGDLYQTQGVLAPGEHILGASPSQGAAIRSGTSYATPIVAGIAALLLSLQRRRGLAPSAAAVRDAILQSALGCEHEAVADCRRLLAGRLFVPGAVARLAGKGTVMIHESSNQGERTMAENVRPQERLLQTAETAAPTVHDEGGVAPSDAACATVVAANSESVSPSDCGCGGKKTTGEPQKVYALGRLGFDYGTRQRREYFRNRIGGDPDDEANLYRYLLRRPLPRDPKLANPRERFRAFDDDGNPLFDADGLPLYYKLPYYRILNGPQFTNRADVTALTWILRIDETPVYAIAPAGPFAAEIHDTLTAFLQSQLPPPFRPRSTGDAIATESIAQDKSDAEQAEYRPRPAPGNDVLYGEGVERIAVPGVIVGSTRLYTGEQVPVIVPDHRGLANWTTDALLDAMDAVAGDDDDARGKIRRFLDRMFELTRNLGTAPRERALNYAATDALMLRGIITDPRYKKEFEGLDLDTIDVTKSPICRPEYDCWDVVVTFYNPDNLLQARRGLRFTIDVSDTLPNLLADSERVFTMR